MPVKTWGPPHLGGGVYEGKPSNMIPDTCVFEAMNVEFTQLAPRTRQDFTVEEASGPGTPPYTAVARFETADGTVYRVMVDSLGDIYAEDEASAGWTQINIFSGKGEVSSIVAALVTMSDVVSDAANPEKWGYGVGIMAQAGDGFRRTDDTGWDTVSTQGDITITLTGAWSGTGVAVTYEIRRRLTIQSDKQIILYPFKNILWISDQLGRMHFWDGTTFGETVCFLNPRDDVEAITEATVAGALPAGKYCYRFMFASETGALCPPSPEMTAGLEFFSITVGAAEKVVLTKKIYAQGFPSWVKKVAVFRTIESGDTLSRYRCTRAPDRYVNCVYSAHRHSWSYPWLFWPTIKLVPAQDILFCRQTSADACEDRRDLPDPQFFYVGGFDLDGTAIEDDVLDEVIQQNVYWGDSGFRTHPATYGPADWTELPTYIQKVLWLTDYAARLFCVSGDNTDELRYSGRPTAYSETGGADEPGWWYPQNARIAGRDDAMQIRAGFELAGRFYVAKDSAVFLLDTRSADPMNWALVPAADNVGAASGRSVLTTTKHAYMLGYVQGGPRMFVFDGFEAKDISDAVRTTLDSLTIDTDAGRAAIDSIAWKEHLIFSAAQSPIAPAVPSRIQIAVDRRTGAWTVWDAPIKRFSKGVPHPSKLLCVKTDDEAKVHSFLNGWGAIQSFFVTKAYEITSAHVWKVFTGFWADVFSESGLVQEDGHADLGMAVWTGSGGGGGGLVSQKDGTHVPVDERKQLWRPLPLNTAGDFVQLKFEIYKLAKDFSVRRLIHEYDAKPRRKTKQ